MVIVTMFRFLQPLAFLHHMPRFRRPNSIRYASTVYALSSGQGKCGVAVIRITGDKARDVFSRMTLPRTLPQPRKATLRYIINSNSGEVLDRGLVLWFPGPHSFTGEDSCELHVHGGSAVIAAVSGSLSALPEFLPAKPGDFTKRAFYNGKLDLTSVEGLADLIHAETEAQRKQALRQMEGSLAQLYMGWRETLLYCRANLEAYIDFSEDENIEDGVVADVEKMILQLIEEIKKHLADERRGERLRSGLHLAILGRPNTGKSSLLNALIQRPAAIVSPIPGTTRDIVETSLDLGGYPIIVSDTAGLRVTEDIIESEGIARALGRAKQADVAIILLEASEILHILKGGGKFDWKLFMENYFKDIGLYNSIDSQDLSSEVDWIMKNNYLILINKIDLVKDIMDRKLLETVVNKSCSLLSIKTQEGFESTLSLLKDICASLCEMGTEEHPVLTSERHRTHIISTLESLVKIVGYDSVGIMETNLNDIEKYLQHSCTIESENLMQSEETLLLAAHHLQRATNSLGHVTGQVTTEDVLDKIFSAFCIGK